MTPVEASIVLRAIEHLRDTRPEWGVEFDQLQRDGIPSAPLVFQFSEKVNMAVIVRLDVNCVEAYENCDRIETAVPIGFDFECVARAKHIQAWKWERMFVIDDGLIEVKGYATLDTLYSGP